MQVTQEEIVLVAGGLADASTERRVLAAALQEEAVRLKLALLQSADAAAPVPVTVVRLKETMLAEALALAGQKQKRP